MSPIVKALMSLRDDLFREQRANAALRARRRQCVDCGVNLSTPLTERIATLIAKGDGKWFASLSYEERGRYEAMAREVETLL